MTFLFHRAPPTPIVIVWSPEDYLSGTCRLGKFDIVTRYGVFRPGWLRLHLSTLSVDLERTYPSLHESDVNET